MTQDPRAKIPIFPKDLFILFAWQCMALHGLKGPRVPQLLPRTAALALTLPGLLLLRAAQGCRPSLRSAGLERSGVLCELESIEAVPQLY